MYGHRSSTLSSRHKSPHETRFSWLTDSETVKIHGSIDDDWAAIPYSAIECIR